ncbi:MAG TPA: hypothetical protein VHN14_29370 [Kofleriaceae bacterium]|jgi:hypothetical protein|nr:hypothetical protein [Kofleriaceae bacterium]
MTLDLDQVRRDVPPCTGLAWFAGEPLALVAASGEPTDAAWPSWDAVAAAAPALLRDGPVASPEVLLRTPAALLLLCERADGVVAVVVTASAAGTGMALVQARMAVSHVTTQLDAAVAG